MDHLFLLIQNFIQNLVGHHLVIVHPLDVQEDLLILVLAWLLALDIDAGNSAVAVHHFYFADRVECSVGRLRPCPLRSMHQCA